MKIRKNYGISLNKRRYNQMLCKTEYWIKSNNPFGKKEAKNFYSEEYTDIFSEKPRLSNIDETKIPKGETYKPVSMFIYDIVEKQNIDKILASIDTLYRKFYKTGFLSSNGNRNSTRRYLKDLQKSIYNENESSIKIGRFDGNPNKTGVKYFDMEIVNLSTSFILVEFSIFFSEETKINLESFASDSYKGKLYSRKQYFNGGRIRYFVGIGSAIFLKERDWYEKIAKIKWSFLNFLNRQVKIPLELFARGIASPSIIMTNTTLLKYDKKYISENRKMKSFMMSVSMNERPRLSEYESLNLGLFNSTEESYHTLQFYYNERGTKLDKNDGFSSVVGQITSNRKRLFRKAAELELLDIILIELRDNASKYARNISKIKMKASNFSKGTKIRFMYEKDVLIFSNLEREIDWNKISKDYDEELPDLKVEDSFTDLHKFTKMTVIMEEVRRIRHNIISLNNKKIEALKSLNDLKHDRSRLTMEIVTFIVSLATFVILVKPDILFKFKTLVEFIKKFGLSL